MWVCVRVCDEFSPFHIHNTHAHMQAAHMAHSHTDKSNKCNAPIWTNYQVDRGDGRLKTKQP